MGSSFLTCNVLLCYFYDCGSSFFLSLAFLSCDQFTTLLIWHSSIGWTFLSCDQFTTLLIWHSSICWTFLSYDQFTTLLIWHSSICWTFLSCDQFTTLLIWHSSIGWTFVGSSIRTCQCFTLLLLWLWILAFLIYSTALIWMLWKLFVFVCILFGLGLYRCDHKYKKYKVSYGSSTLLMMKWNAPRQWTFYSECQWVLIVEPLIVNIFIKIKHHFVKINL